MKKLLFILLVVAFVGAMAFADDMSTKSTISGYVEAGAKIAAPSGGTTTIVQAVNDDGPIQFGLSATLGNFTANYQMEYKSSMWNYAVVGQTNGLGYLTLTAANVSYGLLNNMVTLTAGLGAGGVGGTANKGYGGSGVDGVGVYVTPISGLSVGFGLPVSWTATDISTQVKAGKIGAAYSMAKLFDIALTYQLAGEFDAGINVTAVSGLTAQLEASIATSDSQKTANGHDIELFQNVSYAIGSLTPGVSAKEDLTSGSDTVIQIDPTVAYALDKVTTLGAGVTINLNGSTSSFVPDANATFAFNSMANLKLDANYDTSNDGTFYVSATFWSNF